MWGGKVWSIGLWVEAADGVEPEGPKIAREEGEVGEMKSGLLIQRGT